MVWVLRDRRLTGRRPLCVSISAQLATHEEWAAVELRICHSSGFSKSIELPRAIEFGGWASLHIANGIPRRFSLRRPRTIKTHSAGGQPLKPQEAFGWPILATF